MRLHFDYGTVLVETDEAGSASPPLPPALEACLRWDPRVGALRAPAHRYGAIRAALIDADRGAGRLIDTVSDRLLPPPQIAPSSGLRPYQQQAVHAWLEASRRGVIALPTGSGKTWVAVAAMAEANTPTIVLVPTRALLAQWVAALAPRLPRNSRIGRLGDGHHELGPITVCTFDSGLSHLDRVGDQFGMLVVDEVHHFGGGGRAEALLSCPATMRLGLTGTMPESPRAQARLADLVGPVVYAQSVHELSVSAEGYLARLERVVIPVDLSSKERGGYEAGWRTFRAERRSWQMLNPSTDWQTFARAMNASPEGRASMARYRDALQIVGGAAAKVAVLRRLLRGHHDERTLVFTGDNRAAYDISKRLLIAAITCDIGKGERAAVLAAFGRSELRVLVSSQVLNEGIDLPEASVAVVVGGRQGTREHLQRIGRVLRPSPGKGRALVYELIARDTFEDHQLRRRTEALR